MKIICLLLLLTSLLFSQVTTLTNDIFTVYDTDVTNTTVDLGNELNIDLANSFTVWYTMTITSDSLIEVSRSNSFPAESTFVIYPDESYTTGKLVAYVFTEWYYRKKVAVGTCIVRVFLEGD